ncbi:hypothetical protein GCM10009798_36220 [Nocardioides panacihumi]|uniref:Uncharacterized protein n=1 Tax=Nocardioides panacihumi TaxID=400774 RepID=A0ABN2RMY2_9ACTN
MHDRPELRADIPALEPDAVLLGQLVELSTASTAAATVRRTLRPVRALATGVAALGLVGATTWIAGALPGVPSPIAPGHTPRHAPTAPATPSRTGDAHVPSAAASPSSDASRPHAEASDVATPGASPAWSPPGKPSEQPTGTGGGRAVGHSPSKHPDSGRHVGQHKPNRGHVKGTQGKSQEHSPPTPTPSRSTGQPDDPTTGP